MGLETLNGPEMHIFGSVYYWDEFPWIMNGTLADNIVGEGNYNQEEFNRVLEAVGIDLELSKAEIDMKLYCGIYSSTISPLIKLKIECARVLYHKPEILLIDQAFSSLKCANSKQIFSTIVSELRGKSTILFTNDSHRFVSFCTDFIFIEDGEVSMTGKKEELRDFEEFNGIQIDEVDIAEPEPISDPTFSSKPKLGFLRLENLDAEPERDLRKLTRAMSVFGENLDLNK